MKTRSINTRFFTIFLGTAIVFAGSIFFSIRFILFSEFDKVEAISVSENNNRVKETYLYFLRSYEAKIADWGQWDDTYEFIEDLNKTYIESNLVPETLANLKTDEVIFFGNDKKVKYAVAGPEIEKKEENFPADVEDVILEHGDIWQGIIDDGHGTGLIKTDDGILLYAAHTIVQSDGSGPAKGVIFFGRYIGDWLTEELSTISQTPVSLVDNPVDSKSSDKIYSHISIPVHDSDPVYFQLETKRDVRNEASRGMYLFLILNAVSVFAYVGFNYYFLYRFILMDIINFKDEVEAISKSPTSARKINTYARTSEVDSLRNDVNKLLTVLESANLVTEKKVKEFQELNSLMVDREIKMTELKEIIQDLKKKIK